MRGWPKINVQIDSLTHLTTNYESNKQSSHVRES
jgi:hypothetical protein